MLQGNRRHQLPHTHAYYHPSDSCCSLQPSPYRTRLQSPLAAQDNSLQISYKDWYIYLKEQSNNSQVCPYTQHLLQLESHTDAEPIPLPPSALNIITPPPRLPSMVEGPGIAP